MKRSIFLFVALLISGLFLFTSCDKEEEEEMEEKHECTITKVTVEEFDSIPWDASEGGHTYDDVVTINKVDTVVNNPDALTHHRNHVNMDLTDEDEKNNYGDYCNDMEWWRCKHDVKDAGGETAVTYRWKVDC